VADNAKVFFITFMSIFSAISLVATLIFVFARQENLSASNTSAAERAKKWMWWSYPFAVVLWALFVLTPSKKDSLLILAGGGSMKFLTTDSAARELPHELTSFVVSELKSMAKDAQVDLGIASQKEKILEEAKKMTVDQLMDRARSDSNFAKIVLNR
jgi:hypothetical protein